MAKSNPPKKESKPGDDKPAAPLPNALQGVPGVDPAASTTAGAANESNVAVLDAPPAAVTEESNSAAVEEELPAISETIIRVPIASGCKGYAPTAMGDLTARNARRLARVRDALKREGAKLLNGKPVATSKEAINWLLEQLESTGAA